MSSVDGMGNIRECSRTPYWTSHSSKAISGLLPSAIPATSTYDDLSPRRETWRVRIREPSCFTALNRKFLSDSGRETDESFVSLDMSIRYEYHRPLEPKEDVKKVRHYSSS